MDVRKDLVHVSEEEVDAHGAHHRDTSPETLPHP